MKIAKDYADNAVCLRFYIWLKKTSKFNYKLKKVIKK